MDQHTTAGKRGYLREDFRLFHLKDSRAQEVDYHYHEFDKVVLFLGGKVTYIVEGVTYFLKPWDILLIRRNMIHRPIIDPGEPYERVVIWLGQDYLAQRSDPDAALDECFETVRTQGFHLLRPAPERCLAYMDTIQALEAALRSQEFGSRRLSDLLCQQLMIGINRDVRSSATAKEAPESYRIDQKIEEILRYISDHLQENLSVESISKKFFLSRYYLMRRFKDVTGYTLHQYIRQKRILRAGELLRAGTPVMKAAEQVGYTEYSTFLRAFQSTFHVSPRDF